MYYSTVKVAKGSGKEHISLFIYLFNRFQHDYNAKTRQGKKINQSGRESDW